MDDTVGAECMQSFYDEDLAYIHHMGFSAHARSAGKTVLSMLFNAGIDSGLVVDLGCGSGEWPAMLTAAGFKVLGFDVSEWMIRLASRNAPAAEFHRRSIWDAQIPPCRAVTAFGEVFNYMISRDATQHELPKLFNSIGSSLHPDGLFIFDILIGPTEPPMQYRTRRHGPDWAVLVDVSEQPEDKIVQRKITLSRKTGHRYCRSSEHHTLRVLDPEQVGALLHAAGFRFETATQYGDYRLDTRRQAYFARKGALASSSP